GPQPRVEVEGALTHEFGELSTQKTTTRKWKVKNTGEGDLEIWLLGSTCTCTIPKLKGEGTREVVKPGDATEIELEWKTKDAIGEFSKGATIGTNDPNRPEFMLKVHGMVHSPIVVLPEPHEGVLMVGDISNDKVKEMSLAVFSPEQPKLQLVLAGTASGPISLMPSILRMVAVNGKEGASGQLILLVREGRPT